LNCGYRFEPGRLRTSTTTSVPVSVSSSVNAFSDRFECPIVSSRAVRRRPGSCLLTTSMPESCPSSFVDQMQGAALVGGDVIGLVALDLVLRFLRRSTATVDLVVEVGGVDLRDGPRDLPGLGVPSHMVTDREFARHDSSS